jgi:hypothetical protein
MTTVPGEDKIKFEKFCHTKYGPNVFIMWIFDKKKNTATASFIVKSEYEVISPLHHEDEEIVTVFVPVGGDVPIASKFHKLCNFGVHCTKFGCRFSHPTEVGEDGNVIIQHPGWCLVACCDSRYKVGPCKRLHTPDCPDAVGCKKNACPLHHVNRPSPDPPLSLAGIEEKAAEMLATEKLAKQKKLDVLKTMESWPVATNEAVAPKFATKGKKGPHWKMSLPATHPSSQVATTSTGSPSSQTSEPLISKASSHLISKASSQVATTSKGSPSSPSSQTMRAALAIMEKKEEKKMKEQEKKKKEDAKKKREEAWKKKKVSKQEKVKKEKELVETEKSKEDAMFEKFKADDELIAAAAAVLKLEDSVAVLTEENERLKQFLSNVKTALHMSQSSGEKDYIEMINNLRRRVGEQIFQVSKEEEAKVVPKEEVVTVFPARLFDAEPFIWSEEEEEEPPHNTVSSPGPYRATSIVGVATEGLSVE